MRGFSWYSYPMTAYPEKTITVIRPEFDWGETSMLTFVFVAAAACVLLGVAVLRSLDAFKQQGRQTKIVFMVAAAVLRRCGCGPDVVGFYSWCFRWQLH